MAATEQKFKIINRQELKTKIDHKEKFHLWNVLSKDYYTPDANIAGSQWIPAPDIEAKVQALGVKKDADIVAYCKSLQCPFSKQAAEKLVSLGFTRVSVYEGGLQDWSEGGLPFVTLT